MEERPSRKRDREEKPDVGDVGGREVKRHEVRLPLASRPPPPQRELPREFVGLPLLVLANYFPLKLPLQDLNQYDVTMTPDTGDDCARLKRGLVRQLLPERTYWFDGKSIYLLGGPLDPELIGKGQKVASRTTGNEFIIEFNEVKAQEDRIANPEFQKMIYGNIIRKVLYVLGMRRLGRFDFDVKNPIRNRELDRINVQLFKGLKAAVCLTKHNIPCLAADLVFKVCHTLDVCSLMRDKWQSDRDLISENLEGQIVMTRYSNATFRVDRVDYDKTPLDSFTKGKKGSEQKISFKDYFYQFHHWRIRDLEQPLLLCNVRVRRPAPGEPDTREIYLVPEMCVLTGIPQEVLANPQSMRLLRDKMLVPSYQRKSQIEDEVRKFNPRNYPALQDDKRLVATYKELSDWNLTVSDQMMKVNARVLSPSAIMFQGAQHLADKNTGSWQHLWKSGRTKLYRPSREASQSLRWIVFCLPQDRNPAETFVREMEQLAQPMGIPLGRPLLCAVPRDNIAEWGRTIEEHDAMKGQTVDFAVVLLPSKQEARYQRIKKIITKCPVAIQCVWAENVKGKRSKNVVTGILHQVVAKVGGAPWAVGFPDGIPGTMVVGIDFAHYQSSQRKKSVVGFTATVDGGFTQYYSEATILEQGESMATNLRGLLVRALAEFKRRNQNRLPRTIVFYRAGVSDGQKYAVMENEVDQLKGPYPEFDGYTPRMAFILVLRKCIARFFAPVGGDRVDNPPPGTVVDSDIIPNSSYEFYMISQHSRQGSVSPTHYVVLFDTSGFPAELIQLLTYRLCHLYFNFSASISTPAPLHYAFRQATVIGKFVQAVPHTRSSSFLYYI